MTYNKHYHSSLALRMIVGCQVLHRAFDPPVEVWLVLSHSTAYRVDSYLYDT